MIDAVEFRQFRGFEKLQAGLTPHAYIVGPNSAGKSTVIEAIGLAERCARLARRRAPSLRLIHKGGVREAFPIPPTIDSEEDPVRHDFGRDEARVKVTWRGGGAVHIVWPREGEDNERGYFYLEDSAGLQPRTPKAVQAKFTPVNLVPLITPLERIEDLKSPAYVELNASSRLASRHFRNNLLHLSRAGEFDRFKAFCKPWMPELELLDVTLDYGANRLAVFYQEAESRIPKELAWAGDGIQIWVQLLWHVYRATGASTIVLDEPEVYLHPDLQRRLVRLLDASGAQVILASHSADVIAEAPPEGVLWVDRKSSMARRASSPRALAALSASLGSSYNLALSRSQRARMVIATDAEAPDVLRILAKHIGSTQLCDDTCVSILQLREISHWLSGKSFGEALRGTLPTRIPAVILLQGGHRSAAANAAIAKQLAAPNIVVMSLQKCELENYLLDSEAIAKVSGAEKDDVEVKVTEIVSELYAVTRGAYYASQALVRSLLGGDGAQSEEEFEVLWARTEERQRVASGRRVIAELNEWLISEGHRQVSVVALARAMRPGGVPAELIQLLVGLENRLVE